MWRNGPLVGGEELPPAGRGPAGDHTGLGDSETTTEDTEPPPEHTGDTEPPPEHTGDVGTAATTQTVDFRISVNFLDVGTAIYDILQGEKLEVGFAADMDVDSPFGLIPLAVAETKRIEIER